MTISVETLRRIFLNIEVTVRRRIEAAEALLTYECPPQVVEEAKSFLEEIAVDQNILPDLQTYAAKVLLKASARKVTAPPAARTGERSLTYRIAQNVARQELQKKLEAKGLWPAPEGWDAHIMSPDWPGPPDEPFNPIGLADDIGAARKVFLEEKMVKLGLAKEPKDGTVSDSDAVPPGDE